MAYSLLATARHRGLLIGYLMVVVLYGLAAVIFVNVSWRHWPARVFALPAELPRFRGV